MTSYKYTVWQVPGGAAGALMPVPAIASPKSARYGMVRITGHPGDEAYPSPKPEALPAGPLVRSAQPSYNSPDVWCPSVYYTNAIGFGPDVRYTSTNEVPVPAKSNRSIPGVAFNRPRFGGLSQVTWPPAPQAWQNVNNGGVSG